jgi:hypothetical protein
MKIDDFLKHRPTELNWEPDEAPGPGSTVGERVEHSIAESIRRFFGLFDEPVAELLSIPIRLVIKVIEKSSASYMKPILNYAIARMDESDPFRQLFAEIAEPTGEGAMAMLAGLGLQTGSAGLFSVFEPIFETARQRAYDSHPSKLYDLATWIAIWFRNMPADADLTNVARRQGYRGAWLPHLIEAIRLRPGIGELGQLTQRGEIETGEFLTELKARGMTEADAAGMEKLIHLIPGAGDVIRMAVREAFSPNVISKFELGSEYPAEFEEWMVKQGYDPEWAKRYWYAHWDLPSVSMGYEMLHRGVIGDDDFDLLLKTLDISPFWRDKLKEISFNVYTRVDTRRMYDHGILDEEGVFKSYRDQGYSPDKAQNMTAFTIALSQEDARSASRADIITGYTEGTVTRIEAHGLLTDLGYEEVYTEAYLLKADYQIERKRRQDENTKNGTDLETERKASKADISASYEMGLYTEEEAKTAFTDIGYSTELAEVFVFKVDYQRAQKLIGEAIRTTKELFVNEEVEVQQVHERLGEYNLPATQIEELLAVWTLERDRRTYRPSITQLVGFYRRGRITEVVLREQLKKQKLASDYIDLFVGDANQETLDAERLEAERLLKEQQRESTSTFKDERRIALNALDIQIQELKVYAAELKVLAMDTTDAEAQVQIKKELIAIASEVESLRLQKLQYPIIPLEQGV